LSFRVTLIYSTTLREDFDIMNRIKDFLYNKNDIFIAVVVVALAAIIILWRMNVIIDYPQQLVNENYVADNDAFSPGTVPNVGDEGDVSGVDGDGSGNDGDGSGNDGSGAEGTTTPSGIDDENTTGTGVTGITDVPEMFAIYINPGESIEQIGAIVVNLGYFDTAAEFVQMVSDMGADTKIQMGNHIIPENATKEEVIQYLMEPGL